MSRIPSKDEASTTAMVKGAQAPSFIVDPEKPKKEAVSFEAMVAESELNEEDFEETVKKRGNMWVHFDDKTGAELGTYADRDTAWEKQRQRRHTAKKSDVAPKGGKSPSKGKKAPKSQAAAGSRSEKSRIAKESVMNHIKSMMHGILNESAISYVFEQPQNSEESMAWDKFIGGLSKESMMSDNKLKAILTNLAKSEGVLLNKAVKIVKSTLEGRGFDVESMKGAKDLDTGRMVVNMVVSMPENQRTIDVVVKLENGKPLIFLPDQTRNDLNTIGNDESKLLRAELVHVQEIELDKMDDVLKASDKRDKYLKTLEGKIDKIVRGLGPLEVAVMKNLLKQKYKNVR